MKVLALAPEFFPLGGGASIYSSEMARKFPGNHELHIVTPITPPAVIRQLDRILPGNVFIHPLKGSADSLYQDSVFKWSVAVNLTRLIKATDCDVVSSSSRMPDVLCRPQRLPVPVVTTVHSTVEDHVRALKTYHKNRDTLNRRERRTLAAQRFIIAGENRYYKSQRHFISVSKWGMENLKSSKRVDSGRISLVYNGVDTEKFNPKKRGAAESRFPALKEINALKVLFVGRYTLGKGYHVLSEAMRHLGKMGNVHFVLAGDARGATGCDTPIECTTRVGHVPHSDIPYLYASCDVLVLPSLYENMPLSLLEAMSSCCVPVASDVGGIPEVVQDGVNGRLVESGKPDAIVDAIMEVADDPRRLRLMQSAGRELIEKRHSLAVTIDETLAVFKSVAQIGRIQGASTSNFREGR